MASTATPRYNGESIVFLPVVVPGPGVERVDVETGDNRSGRLMITTGSEPQAGQLVHIRFGEPLYAASLSQGAF